MRMLLPDDGDGWVRRGLGPLKNWTLARDWPRPAARSFRELWKEGLDDER
jgi:hypothetical protein